MFIFELWAEKVKLLGNLDFTTAIAAFFHLCFVFDLKYPKVKEILMKFVELLHFSSDSHWQILCRGVYVGLGMTQVRPIKIKLVIIELISLMITFQLQGPGRRKTQS